MTSKKLKKAVEKELDKNSELGNMGNELIALTALQARKATAQEKPNQYIREFADTIGYKGKDNKTSMAVAYAIIEDLYPKNVNYWQTQDEVYAKTVKGSGWFKANRELRGKTSTRRRKVTKRTTTKKPTKQTLPRMSSVR